MAQQQQQPDIRAQVGQALASALDWRDAHAHFDQAVDGLDQELRGRRPAGMPHSPWEIVEHIRRAQHDILDFCRNPDYREQTWPDDYWPETPEPPAANAWDESVAAFHRDLKALQDLALDPGRDLVARIPHGSGQTYLRELVLVIDHTAYHVGELVTIRRLLDAWH